MNYNFNWNEIEYKEGEDVIPSTAPQNFMKPTFDFGIYYNTNTFYAGIAVDHLNEAKFGLLSANDSVFSSAQQSGVLTATLGKAFILNDNLVLKTSMLVRAANESGNMDINGSFLIKNKILFGLTLRSTKALVFMTELNITKKLRLGAGYDFDATDVAKSTSGSFEVFLGYDVGLFKSKVVSPRYF